MESQTQEAIRYIHNFPNTKITKVAREFEVPISRLRHSLKGRPPKAGQPVKNTKFLRSEETILCRYIDWFDRINLTRGPTSKLRLLVVPGDKAKIYIFQAQLLSSLHRKLRGNHLKRYYKG